MYTLPSGILWRQRAEYEVLHQSDLLTDIFSPIEGKDNEVFFSSLSGEIFCFREGQLATCCVTGGVVTSMTMDDKFSLILGDSKEKCVFHLVFEGEKYEPSKMIDEYKESPLLGVTAVHYCAEFGSLFFADAKRTSSFFKEKPTGSLYYFDYELQLTIPIIRDYLTFPSAIAVDTNKKAVYVADMYSNQIVRAIKNNCGTYIASVFYQFSGRKGLSAIDVDSLGNIYVARFEHQDERNSIDGIIAKLNKDGVLLGELILEKMPEISGLKLMNENENMLLVTENSTKSLLKIKIDTSSFDYEKYE